MLHLLKSFKYFTLWRKDLQGYLLAYNCLRLSGTWANFSFQVYSFMSVEKLWSTLTPLEQTGKPIRRIILTSGWDSLENQVGISFIYKFTILGFIRRSIYCIVLGGVPVLLSPGVHSFPFKLGLPLGLPSTFLGKHGWVQYYCKTALKEANSGLAHKNQQVFIVMNPIDLNQEPAILAVSRY